MPTEFVLLQRSYFSTVINLFTIRHKPTILTVVLNTIISVSALPIRAVWSTFKVVV